MDKLLKLLESDCRYSSSELAVMTGRTRDEVEKLIAQFEKNGIIVGYKALVDWDKTDREYVSAWIELKITPERDRGFDAVAEKIYNYPEVQSLYLMSGAFDLAVLVEGRTMREVANFVSEKLAVMDGVTSTATHFMLKKYKDKGVIYSAPEPDEREQCL